MIQQDCKLLWQWANESKARQNSFSTQPIAWEEHTNWFQNKLQSSNCLILIGVNNNSVSIGLIRYDIQDDRAIISINIDYRYRGLGYGTTLIKLGNQYLKRESAVSIVIAFIRPSNLPSIKAFKKAGFQSEILRANASDELMLVKHLDLNLKLNY